jgi:hypothetical protein
LGRKTLSKVVAVPADKGDQPLHLEVMGTTREAFNIHRVQVKATFKKAQPEAAKEPAARQ